MNNPKDIFSYITQEESAFNIPIQVIDGYDWNFPSHVQLSTLYKNSKYLTGNSDDKPFKNIIRPILNLAYRAVGFDVKDIVLFVNKASIFFKSFLVRKFHEKWARENEMDTFIDSMVEDYCTFGGALIKNVNKSVPEVVPLQSLAFCDQTDILSGPFGIKHYFSPDQLKEKEEFGWGGKSSDVTIDELIVLAENSKTSKDGVSTETPGKYIEIYEVHGTFPEYFIGGESDKYTSQIHIVGFYTDSSGAKQGLTLFKGTEKELPFKFISRDPIYGRALGMGGAEELFEPQVWVNYDVIRMKDMLDAAAKTIMKTTDPTLSAKHPSGLKDVDNLEILELKDNTDLSQVDTYPRNLAVFDKAIGEWERHAQQMGAANETIMGESPAAGTPFKLQELVTAEAHSLHEYRKGKLATFLDEIYRDWVIPHIVREINKGQEFLAELELDELQEIAEQVVENAKNKKIKEQILNGEIPNIEGFEDTTRQEFLKGGNKRFVRILKDELKKAPVDVKVNIAGKQKNLASMTDKLVGVFRQIVMNPAVLDDPRMAKILNIILEYSGLSPIDFGAMGLRVPQQGTGKAPLEIPKEKEVIPT